jgi:hypothetical protein
MRWPVITMLTLAKEGRARSVRKLGRTLRRYRVRDEARSDRPMTADVYLSFAKTRSL